MKDESPWVQGANEEARRELQREDAGAKTSAPSRARESAHSGTVLRKQTRIDRKMQNSSSMKTTTSATTTWADR